MDEETALQLTDTDRLATSVYLGSRPMTVVAPQEVLGLVEELIRQAADPERFAISLGDAFVLEMSIWLGRNMKQLLEELPLRRMIGWIPDAGPAAEPV